MTILPIDLLFESALLLGSIAFSLGVFVLAKDPSNKLHMSYAALVFVIALWALSFFIAGVLGMRTFESIHLITNLLLAPASLFFLQVLLRPDGKFFKACAYLTLALSIIFIPLVTFGFDAYPWIRDTSHFAPVVIVFASGYLYLSESLGVVKPRGTSFREIRRGDVLRALQIRNKWLYIGGAALTMLCVMDRMPVLGRTIPAIANLLLAIYIYGLKDIVLDRDYVNLRSLLGRVLADSGTAFVLAVVFVLTTVWVTDNPLLYSLNVFLVSYLAINSASPIRSLLTAIYQKFFFQEAARVELLIQKATEELTNSFDRRSIGQVLDTFMQQTVGSPLVAFYALADDGKRFEKVLDTTIGARLPESLSVAHPLVQHWQSWRDWKPVLNSELDAEAERSTIASMTVATLLTREALARLDSTLALPLVVEKVVCGFVTLHPDAPPDPWGRSWGILSLMRPLFVRAGEALHDLDVYVSLRERERLAVLGEMSAGLAHEIRNPLGAIKGAAQVLDLPSDDPKAPFVGIIVEEVNRLNAVVTQFLNYAKPFRGESRYIDLRRLILDAIDRFERQQESQHGKAITVSFVGPETPTLAFCQSEPIGRLVANLLENAAQAIHDALNNNKAVLKNAQPKITVKLEQTNESETSLFSLSVEDNGPGIQPEHLEKVFIPFFSLSKNGTGLGLPICQRIAEAHGGRLEISSREREGTKVSFRFPSRRQIEATEV